MFSEEIKLYNNDQLLEMLMERAEKHLTEREKESPDNNLADTLASEIEDIMALMKNRDPKLRGGRKPFFQFWD